jgi:hypothetical protein
VHYSLSDTQKNGSAQILQFFSEHIIECAHAVFATPTRKIIDGRFQTAFDGYKKQFTNCWKTVEKAFKNDHLLFYESE